MTRFDDPRQDEFGEGTHEGDGYDFDGTTSQTPWNRIRNTADRLVSRTLDVAGDIAQRGFIEVEVASLRVRLKTLYARLGELVFRKKIAEEGEDILSDPEVVGLFDQIQATHSEIASERHRLGRLKEMARRDETAGA
ncbi:MAG: hypothetical protein V2A56_09935 [bacterium]